MKIQDYDNNIFLNHSVIKKKKNHKEQNPNGTKN